MISVRGLACLLAGKGQERQIVMISLRGVLFPLAGKGQERQSV